MEKVIFETEDGVQIIGDYIEIVKEAPTALLLHMMPVTRVSWRAFAEKLRQAGFSSLAIDFRGHGDSIRKFEARSTKYETLDYKKFTDREQQEKILDVRGAIEWLEKDRGVSRDHVVIVGASIGANLALQCMTEEPTIKRGVLLSPGLDYRGVKTDIFVRRLNSNQKVLLIASYDDEYSSQTIRELNRLNSAQTELREFSDLGHGTDMFRHKPELMDQVVKWLAIN